MTTPPPPGKSIGRGMLYIAWLLALAALTYVFGLWEKRQYNPNTSPLSEQKNNARIVTLKSNRQGHYLAKGSINQQSVIFLLDTGASNVAIGAKLADKLGLKRGSPHIANTANGTVQVYSTRLRQLRLGNIVLNDVKASINPGMSGPEVLLGMSALKQLEFTQSGNTLTLKQWLR